MMEAARVLGNAECFKPEYSVRDHGFKQVLTISKQIGFQVIFVALDSEESGCFGSLEFVQKFVMPRFVRAGAEPRAVFVLDTVLNVDMEENSQVRARSFIRKKAQKISLAAVRTSFLFALLLDTELQVSLILAIEIVRKMIAYSYASNRFVFFQGHCRFVAPYDAHRRPPYPRSRPARGLPRRSQPISLTRPSIG